MTRVTSILVVTVLTVCLLAGAVAVPFSSSADAQADTFEVSHYECDGVWEHIEQSFYMSSGVSNFVRSPCIKTSEVELSDPTNTDQSWNTVDLINDSISVDDTVFGSMTSPLKQLYTTEGISKYRNSIISNDSTETEARSKAEQAIYEMGNNHAKQILEKNDRLVMEAKRATQNSPGAFVNSGNPVNSQHCGFVPSQSSSNATIHTVEHPDGMPASTSYSDFTADFAYLEFSGTVAWYIHHTDRSTMDSCQEVRQGLDPSTNSVGGVWSPLGSTRTSPDSGGDSLYTAGVSGITSKPALSVGSGQYITHYEDLNPAVSDSISEVDNFMQGTSAASISDGETVMSPSELASQAPSETDAFSSQLLGLSGDSALPDSFGGNSSDVTVGSGYDGAAEEFTVNDSVVYPDDELFSEINGTFDEGETIDLDNRSGGFYITDPEDGTTEYVDNGDVTLDDSPNPDGTSQFERVQIDGTNQTKTIEEFRRLADATENASEVNARLLGESSGAGFFGGDGLPGGQTTLLIIAGVIILIIAMRGGGS